MTVTGLSHIQGKNHPLLLGTRQDPSLEDKSSSRSTLDETHYCRLIENWTPLSSTIVIDGNKRRGAARLGFSISSHLLQLTQRCSSRQFCPLLLDSSAIFQQSHQLPQAHARRNSNRRDRLGSLCMSSLPFIMSFRARSKR